MATTMRATLQRGSAGFRPFLDFFTNMHALTTGGVACRATADGWLFQCFTESLTTLVELFLPRESFAQYVFQAGAEGGAEELLFTFFSTREHTALYRACLPRDDISEITMLCSSVEDCARLSVVSSSSSSESEANVFDLATCDPGGHEFVDIEAQIDVSRFAYRLTCESQHLHSKTSLAVRCHGGQPVCLSLAGGGRAGFVCEGGDVLRACRLPIHLAATGGSTLDDPALAEMRFSLHPKSCALLHAFMLIAPQVGIYVHARDIPCFFKWTFPDAVGPTPYFYMAMSSSIVDGEAS